VGRIVVDASIVDLDVLTFERASVTAPPISESASSPRTA
jgi:hypothetical protein